MADLLSCAREVLPRLLSRLSNLSTPCCCCKFRCLQMLFPLSCFSSLSPSSSPKRRGSLMTLNADGIYPRRAACSRAESRPGDDAAKRKPSDSTSDRNFSITSPALLPTTTPSSDDEEESSRTRRSPAREDRLSTAAPTSTEGNNPY